MSRYFGEDGFSKSKKQIGFELKRQFRELMYMAKKSKSKMLVHAIKHAYNTIPISIRIPFTGSFQPIIPLRNEIENTTKEVKELKYKPLTEREKIEFDPYFFMDDEFTYSGKQGTSALTKSSNYIFPTYGGYLGPGWTAFKRNKDIELFDFLNVPAIDDLDSLARNHDFQYALMHMDYSEAEIVYNADRIFVEGLVKLREEGKMDEQKKLIGKAIRAFNLKMIAAKTSTFIPSITNPLDFSSGSIIPSVSTPITIPPSLKFVELPNVDQYLGKEKVKEYIEKTEEHKISKKIEKELENSFDRTGVLRRSGLRSQFTEGAAFASSVLSGASTVIGNTATIVGDALGNVRDYVYQQ